MSIAPNESLTAVLLGAGGHAKVVLSLAQSAGWSVAAVCDPELARLGHALWRRLRVLGDDAALGRLDPANTVLLNGVGQTIGGSARQRLFEEWLSRGFRFPSLVHPSASVDPSASLAEGAQVMAGAVIQADSSVGANTLINTRASVDHDVVIGAHAHIAPGATLCGGVRVDDGAFVGAGATVVPGRHVGRAAFLAAGALLSHDLPDAGRWPPSVASQESSR